MHHQDDYFMEKDTVRINQVHNFYASKPVDYNKYFESQGSPPRISMQDDLDTVRSQARQEFESYYGIDEDFLDESFEQ